MHLETKTPAAKVQNRQTNNPGTERKKHADGDATTEEK
jgi:hypothetical protein